MRKIIRRLSAEIMVDDPDRLVIRFTCQSCGSSHQRTYGPKAKRVRDRRISLSWMKKMPDYWNSCGGCQGTCPACEKKAHISPDRR